MYNSSKQGVSDYNLKCQLNLSQIQALTAQEGPDAWSYAVCSGLAKYAIVTYCINPSQISISGATIETDGTIEGYDHVNKAQVDASHNLWVRDISTFIDQTYSRHIQQDGGGNTYFAFAPPGSSLSGSVWRISKIDSYGNRQWAGAGAFNQSAAGDLSGLVYTY